MMYGTYTISKNGSSSNGKFTYTGDGYIDFDNGARSFRVLRNNVFGGTGYGEKFTYSGN